MRSICQKIYERTREKWKCVRHVTWRHSRVADEHECAAQEPRGSLRRGKLSSKVAQMETGEVEEDGALER